MEDQIKNKLKGLNVEWDKEKLWEKMEPQLPQRKTNWRKYIGLFMLFLTAFALGLWSLEKSKDEQFKDTKKPISSKLKDIENKDEKINIKNLEQTETNEVKPSTVNDQGSASTVLSSVLPEEEMANEIKQTKTSKKGIQPFQQLSKSDESQFNEKLQATEQKQNDLADVSSKNGSLIDKTREHKANFKNSNAQLLNLGSGSSVALQELPPIAPENIFDKIQAVSFLSTTPISLLLAKERSDAVSVKPDFLPTPDFPFFFLEIGTEIGKPFRKVSLNDSMRIVAQEDKNFENPLLRSSINAKLGILFKQGFYISTGASLENFHEKLNWEEKISNDTSFVVDRAKAFFVLDGNLDTTYHNGPGLVIADSDRKVIHYNRVQYFSIPISFGYQKQWKRWMLGVSTGISFGLGSKFIGKSLRADQDENRMIDLNSAISITKILGWQGKFSMSYLLDQKTAIKFSTGLKGHGQMEMNDLLLSYQTVSVGLGLRRLF